MVPVKLPAVHFVTYQTEPMIRMPRKDGDTPGIMICRNGLAARDQIVDNPAVAAAIDKRLFSSEPVRDSLSAETTGE
jgi:hypothetical protein